MKYNLNFNTFTKLFLESINEIDEAICKNSSTWTLIDDRNINSYAQFPKIYAVMNYLKNISKNIVSFKLPQFSKEQDLYELYVHIKTLSQPVNGKQYSNAKQAKIELYKSLKNSFDWKNEKQLKDIQINGVDYKIGLASNTLSNKFKNPKNIKLYNYILDQNTPSNSMIPIGLFTQNKNLKLDLDTLIVFRMEELIDDTNKKKVLKTQTKNANSLIQLVFNGQDQIIKENETIAFSKKLIDKLKILNLPVDEFDTYNALFGPKFKQSKAVLGNNFDPQNLPDNVKQFIAKSNITVIIAELLIPWLLINGITKFRNVNLIKKLLGDKAKSNEKVISVSWPKGATHGYTDFSISFAKFASGKEIGISAKGDKYNYNFPTILPILLDKNNRNKFSNLNNTLGLCANTLYKVQQKYPRKSIFYCWCMNSAINQSSIPSDDDIEKLYNVFKGLTSDEEKISQTDKRFNIGLKYVQQKYPENIAAWPYSITNIYEKNVVKALNNENGINSSRSTFYNILMGGATAFYQVELYKNNSTVFEIDFKPPKEINQNSDNSSNISFTVLTGSGNESINSNSNIKDLQNIAKGGGKKAVIGFQLK